MPLPNLSDTFCILSDLTSLHQIDIANHATQDADTSDEESKSNCPIFTSFYEQGGCETVKSMTSFTLEGSTALWLLMAEPVARYWNTGWGRKFRASGSDALVMVPTVRRHGQQRDFMRRLFSWIKALSWGLPSNFLVVVSEHTYEVWVNLTGKMEDAEKHQRKEDVFWRRLCSLRHDVTFQQGCRPSGSAAKKKQFFPGKLKLYEYKVESLVTSLGLVTGCTRHYPRFISDVETLRQNSEFHNGAPKKYVRELDDDDNGLFQHRKDDFWAILADKGYQDASDLRGVAHHIWAPIHEALVASSWSTIKICRQPAQLSGIILDVWHVSGSS